MYDFYCYARLISSSHLWNWFILKPESGDENIIITFSSPIFRDENLLWVFSSPEMKTHTNTFSSLRDKNLKYTFSPMLEIKTHITSFYLWRSKCIICVLISRRSKPCSHVFISGDKNIHFIVSTLRDENVFVHKPQGRWKLIFKVFSSVGDEDLVIKSLTLIEIKTCFMSFQLHSIEMKTRFHSLHLQRR